MSTAPTLDEVRTKAARVAAWSEVNDVRLFKATCDLVRMPDSGPYRYDMDADVSVQFLPEDGGLIVTSDYTLSICEGGAPSDDEDGDGDSFYELTFRLAALFNMNIPVDATPLDEAELDAFAKTTGQFALHPYARDFIAQMTGRAGLPSLHVGLLKLRLDTTDENIAAAFTD